MSWRKRALARRADRARERQLDYMRGLARSWEGKEEEISERLKRYSRRVRDSLHGHRPIAADDRVLEVGSGATGAIFYFGTRDGVGIDPLADHYAALFPWQRHTRTLAAPGEALPFGDETFDVVLSDNVIDHAENPGRIVAEMARVLKPGGILFLTVHFHHPVYHLASAVYGGWNALGLRYEVTPFADHTVHLTKAAAKRFFDGLPLRIVSESDDFEETKRKTAATPPRHAGDRLKRVFYKNVMLEVIAIREARP